MKQENYFFHFKRWKSTSNIYLTHNLESNKLTSFEKYGLSKQLQSKYSYTDKDLKAYIFLGNVINRLDSCILFMNTLGFEIKQITTRNTDYDEEVLVLLNSKF